jgi:uncharacterized membrane protein
MDFMKTKNKLIFIFVIIFVVSGISLFSENSNQQSVDDMIKQIENITNDLENTNAESTDNVSAILKHIETQQKYRLYIILMIVASTIVILVVLLFLTMNKEVKCLNSNNILNIIGLVLIIQGTILALVATNSTEQLTPAIGIIGAVAGYIFGSSKIKQNESEGDATEDKAPIAKSTGE